MNRYSLPIILLLITGMTYSQQRDLKYFLDQARINSPLIQKNKNNNKIVELDLQQTERILKNSVISLESNILFAPIITHNASSNRLDIVSNGSESYSGYDLAITNGGQYQAFLALKQPLTPKSSLAAYSRKSELSRKQNENSTILTIHEIEQLVSNQYLICLKSKVQIKNERIQISNIDAQMKVMQKLVENAILKQTDLLLLEIERQNMEIDSKSFNDDYKANLYDLNLICGIKDSTTIDIQEIDLQLRPDIASNSQLLISYTLDSLMIASDLSITELKYKPQLNLFANAGLNAVYIPTFNRLGFSAGLTFSWNLYDGNQRKLDKEKSNVNINTLQFEKAHFMSQLEINKNKIKSQINSLNERTILIENQLKEYDKLYTAYQHELTQGLISVMDFKNLMKDITVKRQQSLLLKMEKLMLINSYNYWNY